MWPPGTNRPVIQYTKVVSAQIWADLLEMFKFVNFNSISNAIITIHVHYLRSLLVTTFQTYQGNIAGLMKFWKISGTWLGHIDKEHPGPDWSSFSCTVCFVWWRGVYNSRVIFCVYYTTFYFVYTILHFILCILHCICLSLEWVIDVYLYLNF